MKGQEKKTFVRGMFDDIHDRYDFLNTVLSFGQDRRWRRRAVRGMPQDGPVIDLCAAGGEMALELFRRRQFGGEVVLADISRGMLSLSRKILEPRYEGRYSAVVCDAENLPFKAGVFSGAMSAFCLRNLSDLRLFTSETRRVLAYGACARHLEIAHPRNRFLSVLFKFYFYKFSPWVARLFTSKGYAYKYLPNSLKAFPPQKVVVRILGQGWDGASYENIMGGMAAIYELTKRKS